jgi:hypothetical protein
MSFDIRTLDRTKDNIRFNIANTYNIDHPPKTKEQKSLLQTLLKALTKETHVKQLKNKTCKNGKKLTSTITYDLYTSHLLNIPIKNSDNIVFHLYGISFDDSGKNIFGMVVPVYLGNMFELHLYETQRVRIGHIRYECLSRSNFQLLVNFHEKLFSEIKVECPKITEEMLHAQNASNKYLLTIMCRKNQNHGELYNWIIVIIANLGL